MNHFKWQYPMQHSSFGAEQNNKARSKEMRDGASGKKDQTTQSEKDIQKQNVIDINDSILQQSEVQQYSRPSKDERISFSAKNNSASDIDEILVPQPANTDSDEQSVSVQAAQSNQPMQPIRPSQPRTSVQPPQTPNRPMQPMRPMQPPHMPIRPPQTPTQPTQPMRPLQPQVPQPLPPMQPQMPNQPIRPSQPQTPMRPPQPQTPNRPMQPMRPTQPPQASMQSMQSENIDGPENRRDISQGSLNMEMPEFNPTTFNSNADEPKLSANLNSSDIRTVQFNGTGEPAQTYALQYDIVPYEQFAGENQESGRLKIQAYAARQAIPLQGVKILVGRRFSDGDRVFFNGTTDENGLIENILLPAPSKNLSLNSGNRITSAKYDLYAELENIEPLHYPINIYDSVETIQPIVLRTLVR